MTGAMTPQVGKHVLHRPDDESVLATRKYPKNPITILEDAPFKAL